ncbi:DNA alkylation repair protein [Candidatus Woesearchaeota archaeon]|nr:DNA alkylation repair protein [Candidatus Woesearchaeota archaeon]
MLNKIKEDLQKLENPEKAKILSRFFKTGKGEYAEGDIFLGIIVPEQRKLSKKYIDLTLNDLEKLLESKVHEYRLTALFILVHKYEKANKITKKKIFDFYLSNTKYINNWDLIDLSSHKILGDFLYEKNKDILYKLAKSSSLWERRISIISTYYFIRKNNFEDTLNISKLLLNDKEDLIQKAVGWMLREVGKRNLEKEEEFLRKYYKKMPRTMLRYAIERFKEEKKGYYMAR